MKRRIAIILCFAVVFAVAKGQQADSLKKGITLGYDVSGLAVKLFQNYRTSADFSLTAGSFNRYNYTVEAGFLKIDNNTSLFNYKSNGKYLRAGLDYNFYKKKGKGDDNTLMFIGARYGLSSLLHSASNVTIIDEKWGNVAASVAEKEVKSQWVELTGGLRVAVWRNLSLGWSGRLRFLINSKGAENIKPFIIPGYGKGTSNTVIDLNYSIYYTIPFSRNYKLKPQ
jgi:hypothetical protein